ncbi:MAG TPA: hypothetical protein VN041_13060 [Microbacterium sp.]|nr:hypothetical protein [Microbacterium sp.]
MNAKKTHAQDSNGTFIRYFQPPMSTTTADYLRYVLGLVDGEKRTTFSIWRLPEPGGDPMKRGETFIQAAGGSDKMAIEARVMTSDGTAHLYAVGRQEPHDDETTTVPISDKHVVRVFTNEIFTADEAAVIFMTFYLTDAVGRPYQLREIDLSVPQSEER